MLAFLDNGPLSEGHVLEIPQDAQAHLPESSDESAAAIGRVLPRICRAVLQATGATSYNVLQNNGRDAHQEVMHVHFHIVPKIDGQGLGLVWKSGKLDGSKARMLVARLAAALEADGHRGRKS